MTMADAPWEFPDFHEKKHTSPLVFLFEPRAHPEAEGRRSLEESKVIWVSEGECFCS